MTKKKRIVIDASIARASGGVDATHPTSMMCRDFLEAVRKISHMVVLPPELMAEWNRHKSGFARTWLVSMFARRKVQLLNSVLDEILRERIRAAAVTENQCDAMLKDTHLIEAAMATDWTVTSTDDRVRTLFSAACKEVGEINRVSWVNPGQPGEDAIAWLMDGAQAEKERQLGAWC